MALFDAATLVRHAHRHGYGVAQVNTNGATYGLTRAIAEVAEEEQAPVIFGAYEANLAYRGFDYAGMQMRWFAEHTDAPLAIHLDHGSSLDSCRRAIAAGFTSVMIDGSTVPIERNIELTRAVSALARGAGVSIEAEVGELQKLAPDGSMSAVKNLTSPEEVARICAETDIDMLAVGIGNAHGFYKGQPDLHLDLLERLAAAATVPLVLHGTTGLADDVVGRCIDLGMAKVNLGTLIRTRYVEYTAEAIGGAEHKNHPWRVAESAKDRVKDHVRHIIRVTRSNGRAPALMSGSTD